MLERPIRGFSRGFMVEKLKRLQLLLGKNHLKNKKEDKEGKPFAKFDRLPTELLILIFSHLNPDDLSRIMQVCRRFTQICTVYRPCFSYRDVNALAVRYGVWRDVIKQRILPGEDQTTISYRLLTDNLAVQEPKKVRRSGFFNSHREKKAPSFNGVVQNCRFETILITSEMLNGEIRTALRLNDLNTSYIYIDLSHHSLQLRALERYLPGLSEDLNNNLHIKSIDCIFKKRDEESNLSLEHLLKDRIDGKNVTVIFIKSRSN
jgi:hypothetical protein